MKDYDKAILKQFLEYPIPNGYIDSFEKDMYSSHLAGVCEKYISKNILDFTEIEIVNKKNAIFTNSFKNSVECEKYDSFVNLVILIINSKLQ